MTIQSHHAHLIVATTEAELSSRFLFQGDVGYAVDTGVLKHGPGSWSGITPAGIARTGDTLTGELVVPDLKVSGLTGATQTGRYVGQVAGAAPVTGTFVTGDWVFDVSLACQWLCTAGGSPGTWVRGGTSGTELGYTEVTNYSAVAVTSSLADCAGLSVTVTVGTRPIFVQAYIPATSLTFSAANARFEMALLESSTILNLADTPGKSASSGTGIVGGSIFCAVRLAPSAGSHTYKVQVKAFGTTAASYTSGATFPAFIRVVEA